MTPAQLLTEARRLLERPDARTTAAWPRTAALLARQALEQSLDAYWKLKGLPLDKLPTGPQLICLSDYLTDESLGERVRHAWGALSDACHHHPYELAPSAVELRGWIETVSAFAHQAQAPEPR